MAAFGKVIVDERSVLRFIQEKFNRNIPFIESINEGEGSAAFFYKDQNHDLVIRINYEIEPFEKDKYAYENFTKFGIPIPQILEIGKYDNEKYYAISTRSQGNLFYTFKDEKLRALLADFIRVSDAIHSVDINKTKGFGYWHKDGSGAFASWRESVVDVCQADHMEWGRILTETFFEKEFYDAVYNRLLKQVRFVPEIRNLVHADFGVNNVIAQEGKITGVLDWGDSQYGDFLYDTAWLDFWKSQIDFKKIFYEHYRKMGINLEYFEERVLCYQMQFGLGAMHFFAKTNQKDKYDWAAERLSYLLSLR